MSSSSSNSITEEGDSVPEPLPGFKRFCPTDEELVSFYLKKKIQGRDHRFRRLFPEIDLCKHDPCDLPAVFFTRLDLKYSNSDRRNRATEQGFYKSQGKERKIYSQSKAVIGRKRILTYYIGRVPNAQKTDYVIHEYRSTETEPGSNPNQQRDIVLCCLKNKKLEDTSIYDEFSHPGTRGFIASGSENQAAAAASNRMIADTEEFLAYEELENAVFGSDNHDNSQAGGGSPSDFDDQAVDDMIQELQLCAELEDLDSSFLPELPQLGNVPDAYNGEWSNWQSPIGENVSYLTNENNISTNYGKEPVSNIAYGAPHERISEENLESSFYPFQLEDYTFFYSEPRDVLHANNGIGCNESQFPYPEISTLFPRSS